MINISYFHNTIIVFHYNTARHLHRESGESRWNCRRGVVHLRNFPTDCIKTFPRLFTCWEVYSWNVAYKIKWEIPSKCSLTNRSIIFRQTFEMVLRTFLVSNGCAELNRENSIKSTKGVGVGDEKYFSCLPPSAACSPHPSAFRLDSRRS